MPIEQFLNDPDDVQWLKATHLDGMEYPDFHSFILRGNEDAPEEVILFASQDPGMSESRVARIRFIDPG